MRWLRPLTLLLLCLPGIARAEHPLEVAQRNHERARAQLPAFLAEHGEARIKKNIDRFRMALVEEKLVGTEKIIVARTQLIVVAGEIAIRVVDEASGIAFIFLDPGKINPEDPALRRYLAEQHVNSGTGSPVRRNGRDAVYVWTTREAIQSIEEKPRQQRFTEEWWTDWKLATLRKPSAGDVALGTACALAYGGLAVCMSLVRQHTQNVPFSWDPAAFTALWSLTYGTFVQTLSNYTLRGNTARHLIKQSAFSAGFNYTFMFITQGFANTMTIHDPAALLAHFYTGTQVLVNSIFNFNVRAFFELREDAGRNTEPLVFTLPNGKVIEMDRAASERNLVGTMFFPLSALDVMGAGTRFPGTELPMPLGKIAMLSLIPIIRRATLSYSEHLGVNVETNRKRWEHWLPVRMWKGFKDSINHPYTLPPDTCGRFLRIDSSLLRRPGDVRRGFRAPAFA